jgi:hypothetical protein
LTLGFLGGTVKFGSKSGVLEGGLGVVKLCVGRGLSWKSDLGVVKLCVVRGLSWKSNREMRLESLVAVLASEKFLDMGIDSGIVAEEARGLEVGICVGGLSLTTASWVLDPAN